jgi:RNA recognition motif-containing protein
VGNLPRVVSKEEIENIFVDLGRIRDITVHHEYQMI